MAVLISALVLASASAPQCPDVLDYAGWKEAPGQAWNFRWPSDAPKLVVIGAQHSREPQHEQFARIAAAFREAQPTVVFFEGPDRGEQTSETETIRNAGESGFVRYLARQAGIETRSLEPSPGEQFGMLAGEFPIDQVMLFFVLRETVRLRDREGLEGEALDAAVAQLLQSAAKMGAGVPFSDPAGLDAAARRHWPERDWRQAEAKWFGPNAVDAETGGLFTGAINRADSMNRDRHMVKLLSEAVKGGERPFAVVGRNHVPMQTPALACALER